MLILVHDHSYKQVFGTAMELRLSLRIANEEDVEEHALCSFNTLQQWLYIDEHKKAFRTADLNVSAL